MQDANVAGGNIPLLTAERCGHSAPAAATTAAPRGNNGSRETRGGDWAPHAGAACQLCTGRRQHMARQSERALVARERVGYSERVGHALLAGRGRRGEHLSVLTCW